MNKLIIPENSTVADVISKLRKPEDYLCEVLKQMTACQKLHGNAVVRIGVMGEGKYPAYRVEYPVNVVDIETEETVTVPNGNLFGAWRGMGHGRFSNYEVQEQTWSSVYMTIDEVRSVLGEHRSVKKKKA